MRTGLFLPSLLLALFALPAAAQADPPWMVFFPSSEGDEWTYRYEWTECTRPQGSGCQAVDTTLTYRIVGTREIDGRPIPIFEGPGGRVAYGINPADSTVVVEVIEDLGRGLPLTPPTPSCGLRTMLLWDPLGSDPRGVQIGPVEYTLRETGYNCPPATQFAEGVGLVSSYYNANHGGGASESEQWTLLGAVVGGHTYGSYATAEEGPPGDPTFTLLAAPNPASREAVLHVESPGGRAVRLDVLDALGRVVWSSTGSGRVVVPLDAVPAGVYVIRAVADGQTVARTMLTRTR